MATNQQKGNCYLCGAELGKVAMKNHILKLHDDPAGEQECRLVKVEGMDKRYWLLLDLPLTASLKNLDDFLRKIWLECCGHMSAFMGLAENDAPVEQDSIFATSPDDDNTELDKQIEDLDLSVRSYNCLKRAGIHSVRQLVEFSENDLLNRSWCSWSVSTRRTRTPASARPAPKSWTWRWIWPCQSPTPPAWAYAPMKASWTISASRNTRKAIRSDKFYNQ